MLSRWSEAIGYVAADSARKAVDALAGIAIASRVIAQAIWSIDPVGWRILSALALSAVLVLAGACSQVFVPGISWWIGAAGAALANVALAWAAVQIRSLKNRRFYGRGRHERNR